jgi:hypothetical protein
MTTKTSKPGGAADRVLAARRVFTGATAQAITDGAVAVRGDTVAWAGPRRDLPPEFANWPV